MNKKFNNIISLGFFCSPARELERMGIRGGSYPFDWVISDLENNLELIDNNFCTWLDMDNLDISEDANIKNAYCIVIDKKNNIEYYHDFVKNIDISQQIEGIKSKYKRRIDRLYESMKESTLFVRYIKNISELTYIQNSYNDIKTRLKKYNRENEIVFICNEELKMNLPEDIIIYYVKKDKNDVVSRKFIRKNKKLRKYILNSTNKTMKQIYNNKKRYFSKKVSKLKRLLGGKL